MRKLIRLFFVFITFTFVLNSAQAQEQRTFDKEKLEAFRANPDFQYELVKAEPKNAFEKAWDNFWDWFFGLFEGEGTGTLLEIFIKVLLFIAFLYFVIKLLGVEVNTVFKPAKKSKLDGFEVREEDLASVDFELEIKTSLEQNNYRLAIRLMYLFALVKASNAGLVQLKQGKTNREYAYELAENKAAAQFNELNYLFEYTWYGHFEANENIAGQAQNFLSDIDKTWRNER